MNGRCRAIHQKEAEQSLARGVVGFIPEAEAKTHGDSSSFGGVIDDTTGSGEADDGREGSDSRSEVDHGVRVAGRCEQGELRAFVD